MGDSVARVVFLQSFGRRDLFTDVPPEQLTGWRRNVGLLVTLLRQRGIAWQERYAARLSEVSEGADLFVLRDWRYPAAEVEALRQRFAGVPLLAMLFQVPHHFLAAQRRGEERALFGRCGEPSCAATAHDAERGLFLADRVVVRSALNRDLFGQRGHPAEKMVLLPHAPVWTHQGGRFRAMTFPRRGRRNEGFHVLFVGDSPVRKGLFRLHEAFASLDVPGKRLHVYCRALDAATLPAGAEERLRALLSDDAVTLHGPYRGLEGLVDAHAGVSVLACPSLIDNGPNTLVEGRQLGTPLLASDLCGALEEVGAGAETVAAPRWWLGDEESGAYARRLAEALLRCQRRDVADETPPDLSGVVERIVETWRMLLRELGL